MIFLVELVGNDEQNELKKSKIGIELIDLINFLALSSNFGRIPKYIAKYIDDRTVTTHLEMAITNDQTACN